MPVIGHDAKAGTAPKRHVHRELRCDADDAAPVYEVRPDVGRFDLRGHAKYVDVVGTSKGKGFRRGHEAAQLPRPGSVSHGVKRKHRSPGSINGHATNLGTGPKLKKGKRMAGHMGDERVTVPKPRRRRTLTGAQSSAGEGPGAGPEPGHGVDHVTPVRLNTIEDASQGREPWLSLPFRSTGDGRSRRPQLGNQCQARHAGS